MNHADSSFPRKDSFIELFQFSHWCTVSVVRAAEYCQITSYPDRMIINSRCQM